jgi:PsbP
MKLNFCVCVLSIVSAIAILAINQSVNAQSDNFKNYTNKDMKFSIQHPSNWKVQDEILAPNIVVWFQIPDRNQSHSISDNFFAVSIEKVNAYLDTDTMSRKNTTLQQYEQQMTDAFLRPDLSSYTVIRQNEVTAGGNTGWKIEYGNTDSYNFEILTIANGKLYRLLYNEDPLSVPETLPIANKMVESFQFTK